MTPGGRLTLIEAFPYPQSDVTEATTIYYAPATGGEVPVFDGTEFTPFAIGSGLSYNLSSYHTATNLFDLFAFDQGGVLTLGSGPAWTSDTLRSAELDFVDGIWVNKNNITLRYGTGAGDTVPVDPHKATMLGTFCCRQNAGQVSDNPRRRMLANAYNLVERPLGFKGDLSSWSYTTGAWRVANNDMENTTRFIQSVPGRLAKFSAAMTFGTTLTGEVTGSVGIGLDSTTVDSSSLRPGSSCSSGRSGFPHAMMDIYSGVGFHYAALLEFGGGSTNQTWYFYAACGLKGIVWQ